MSYVMACGSLHHTACAILATVLYHAHILALIITRLFCAHTGNLAVCVCARVGWLDVCACACVVWVCRCCLGMHHSQSLLWGWQGALSQLGHGLHGHT